MASNAKKMKRIRARKAKPNRTNEKKDLRRIQDNARILRELAESDNR